MVAFAPLVLTMVLWGSAFSVSRLAIDDVGRAPAAALRYGLGASVILILLKLTSRGAPPLTRHTWSRFFVAGAIGIALYNALFFIGLSLAPAIEGSSIMPVMSPVFTVTLAMVVARGRPSALRVGALALGLGGALTFFLTGPGDAAYPQRVRGDAFYLAAAFCWAIYTFMGRRLMTAAEPFRVSTWAMVFGAVLLMLWAAPGLTGIDWPALPADLWVEIIYLAVLPTALGYALYTRGCATWGRRLPRSSCSWCPSPAPSWRTCSWANGSMGSRSSGR